MQKSAKCKQIRLISFVNVFTLIFSIFMDAAPPTDFSNAKFFTTFVMLLVILKSHQESGHYCVIPQWINLFLIKIIFINISSN